MEPTSGQRKAVFVLVVLVLAGLGTYLFVPAASGAFRSGPTSSPSPRSNGSGSGGTATNGAQANSAQPNGAPATTGPTPTATATPAAGPDIYQWLPFTRPELAAAARVVTEFGDAYGTFSYSENAAGYVAAMRNLIMPALSEVLARGYAAPGVASLRVSQKQVATGTAAISSLRAFGASSLTFVVTVSQQLTDTKGRSTVSVPYAVTATGGGSSWQVSDIELASAGNP
jgi:hypothetical protein